MGRAATRSRFEGEGASNVLSELPNLDEDVSFVVDNGASVGPIAMRLIADSIASGTRAASSLVWWQGATDWIRFDSHPELKALTAREEPAEAEVDAVRWNMPEHVDTPFANAENVQSPEPVAAIAQPGPSPLASQPISDQPVEAFEPQSTGSGLAAFEPAAVEPQQNPEPVAAALAVETEVTEAEAADTDTGEFSFNLPMRDTTDTSETEPSRALTGLFSSGSRSESPDDADSQMPSPDALDAILAARQSLESVGARIEALSSATRRSMSPEEFHAAESGASLAPDGQWTDVDPATVAPTPVAAVVQDDPFAETQVFEPTVVESTRAESQDLTADEQTSVITASGWTDVEGATSTSEQLPATAEEPVANDAARLALTERFDEMVRKSEAHQRRIEWIMRVDELLLSSCITAIADSGYSALDLNSRESEHRVLFDHNDDSRRVRLDLSPVKAVSESFGRHVRFGLSWGRDVSDPDRAFAIVRQHTTEETVAPGVVTCEADMASSSVSTRVELIFAADDFVKDDYSVDRGSLDSSIAATLHALEQRWHQLFHQ